MHPETPAGTDAKFLDTGPNDLYESDEEAQISGSRLLQNQQSMSAEIEMSTLNKDSDYIKSLPEALEKLRHFQRSSGQYEKLYSQYLERTIIAERELAMTKLRQKRLRWIVQVGMGCLERWDNLGIQGRQICLVIYFVVMVVLVILSLAL